MAPGEIPSNMIAKGRLATGFSCLWLDLRGAGPRRKLVWPPRVYPTLSKNLIILAAAGVLCLIAVAMLFFLEGKPPAPQLPPPAAPVAADPAPAPAAEAPPQVAEAPAESTPPAAEAPVTSGPQGLLLTADEIQDIRTKLRQIALGIHNFESSKRAFPPGRDSKVNAQLSWRVLILPYIEQGPLYKRFNLNEPWDSPHNKALIEHMPDIYRTAQDTGSDTRFMVFTGPNTMFVPGRGASHAMCRDGTSNTLMVVHTGDGKTTPWTSPDDVAFEPAEPLAQIGSVRGRIEAVLFDASSISLPRDIDPATVAGLVTPAGNELIDGPGIRRKFDPGQGAQGDVATGKAEAGIRDGRAAANSAMNRLKQVALAMHNSHDARKMFPAAVSYPSRDGKQSPGVSWRVMVLPFTDQQALYRRYQMDLAWDEGANRELLPHMPSVFRHESEVEGSLTRLQVFTGRGTAFGVPSSTDKNLAIRGPQMKSLVDGSSNTIMAIESGRDRAVQWSQPRDLEFNPDEPLACLGEMDATGTFAAMFDGSVRVIENEIDPLVLRQLVLRGDASGEVIADEPPESEAAPPGSAAPANVVAQVEFAAHKLERPAFHFAYDPVTGHLMAAEYEQNQATLYSLDDGLQEIAAIPSPARPTVVLAKQYKGKSYFLVGGQLDKRIDVFDAADGKRVESVHLETPAVLHLASSARQDDPYVYYSSGNIEQQNYYVGRLNLDTFADEGYLSEGADFELSADGAVMYLRERLQDSTSLSARQIVEGTPPQQPGDERKLCNASLVSLGYNSDKSSTGYVPGPGNAFVAADKGLYSYSLEDVLGEFDFPVESFSGDRPWALGVTEGKLFVGSVNDKRTLVAAPLPEGFDQEAILKRWVEDPLKVQFTRPRRMMPVFVDVKRDRVVVAMEDQLAVAALTALGLPDEPLVAVNCPGRQTAPLGKSLSLPITPLDKRVKVRIASAPVGAKLANGVLSWTPADADVGPAKLLIESAYNQFRLEQPVQIQVERPAVKLPSPVNMVSLSPDGKLAVVWNTPTNSNNSDQSGPTQLMLIDVATRAVKAKSTIEKGVWLARVDDQGVYVLSRREPTAGQTSPSDVMMLNIEDLSLETTVSAVGGTPMLEPIGGKYLLACYDRFLLPKLKKIESLLPVEYGETPAPYRTAGRIHEGWQFGGAVWEEDLSRAAMIIDPRTFVGGLDQNEPRRWTGWGRYLAGGGVMAAPDKQIIQSSGGQFYSVVVSPNIPVTLVLDGGASTPDGRPQQAIRVLDLVAGKQLQSIVLSEGPTAERNAYGWGAGNELDAAGETIAACINGRLHLVSQQEIKASALKAPFRVQLRQDPLVVSAGKGQATYELLDGTPPYDVKLTIQGFETRTTTDGVASFTLDGLAIAANEVATVNQKSWPQLIAATADNQRDRVIDHIDAVTPAFKLLTGRAPNGVPVLVRATIEATDKRLQRATMTHSYFVELAPARVVRTFEESQNGRQANYSPKTPFGRERPAAAKAGGKDRDKRREQLDRELATDYGDRLRQAYPHSKLTGDAWKTAANKALKSAEGRLEQNLGQRRDAKLQQMRTWSDKKGHTTVARMKTAFADQVVLQLQSGNEVTVPLEKLSEPDLEFVAQHQAGEKPAPGDMAVAQLQLVMQGMDQHVRRTGGFPPAYIVDAQGKPLLSWRVALLTDVGGGDLLKLFHFDEPWDSEHNGQLLAYMPAAYKPTQTGVPADSTTLLGFRGDNSVLADGRSLIARELKDPADSVVVLGEVRAAAAVPWTKPDDVSAKDFAKLAKLLNPHGDHFLVGTADNNPRTVPVDTSVQAWQRALNHADGATPPISFGYPK